MNNLKELISATGGIISTLIIIVAAAGLLVFLWGLAKFIFKVGRHEKAHEEGRNTMIWGLIALFIMFSVWGIIGFFQRELKLPDPSATSNRPSAPLPAQPGILPSRSYNLTPPNAPQPGILPSRSYNLVPPNAPEPGILPSRDYNYLLDPPNAPKPGNAPTPGNRPWYYFGF